MFTPKYTITEHLLANIKRVNFLVTELNNRRFPHVVLVEFERLAREISTYASTSIEGNPLPLTEVKKVLKSTPDQARKSEQEVLNYNQVLEELNKLIAAPKSIFDLNLILKIHKTVVTTLIPSSQIGKLRTDPVFVNDPRTRQSVYLPPDAQDVPQLIEELVTFVNISRGKIDPLILAGIFHKQFVIIHPFMDGNGRTARLTTKVLLADMGLNTFNLFSFENYYNQNVTRYFQTVGEYGNYYELTDKIDFTPWLEYFTEGLIDELLRVQKLLSKTAVSPKTELKPHHHKILKIIDKKGFIADSDYAQVTDRAKATRALDFKHLMGLGLIIREGKGRATYYKRKKIM